MNKKVISMILVLAMLFALLVPAFALAEEPVCPDTGCEGHTVSMTKVEAKDSTCTEEGNKAYYHCTKCGRMYDMDGTTILTSVKIAAKHTPGTKHAEVAATETAEGTKEYYDCTKCTAKVDASGKELTDLTIPKLTGSGNKTGYITNCNSYVTVREKATSDSKKLGTAAKNNEYTILGTSGNWTKIQYTSTQAGYVFSKYIKVGSAPVTPSETPAKAGQKLKIVNCSTAVNVRSEASSSSAKLGTAAKGNEYTLLSTVKVGSSTWYKVQYTSSKVGYVFSSYGKVVDSATPSETLTIVNCNTSVVVRAQATSDSAKLGDAKKGTTYPCYGKSGNWYKIQYTSTKVGYVFYKYGSTSGEVSPSETAMTGYGVVTGNTVWVRKGAGTSYATLGLAKLNEVYEITAKAGTWYKIKYDGGNGYISASYFSKVISSKKTATVANCTTSVNVRASASTSGKILGSAPLGAEYPYLKATGSYYMISYNGSVGYIHKSYAKIG